MPIAKLPILFNGDGSTAEVQTLRLSEESPRFLKRFGPSNLIVDQVPDFVNRDHESFRRFIEVYYEWLELYENAYGLIDAFSEHADIDKSIGVFFSEFREMYLQDFPSQLAFDSDGNIVSEANFLKNARNFYGAKGTEKSFKFLFRLLYNVVSEVGYPGKDILRVSDGRWVERVSVKTTNVGGTANDAVIGKLIYQSDPLSGEILASAVVSDIVRYTKEYYDVSEFFIKNLYGEFEANKPIYSDVTSMEFQETVYPIVKDVVILNGGSGYSKSDVIQVVGTSDGIGFDCVIDLVDEYGKIKGVKILDSGVGYGNTFSMLVKTNSGDGNASLVSISGGQTNYPGFYVGNDGKLSSNKKVFDGDYYQDYSYALRSEISFTTYRELYKKLVHPAGFKMFGEILIKRNLIDSLPFHSELQRYEIPYIGHYTPYRMGTTADLYNRYLSGFNPRGNTYSTYQNYGLSGGKLIIQPVGFTFTPGMTWGSIAASGAAGNLIVADVFEFGYMGPTLGALYLKTIDFDLLNLSSVTGGGFVEGSTLSLIGGATGSTASIRMVRNGIGIVPELGGFSHDAQGLPLGSSGSVEGYIEAQGFSYAYWDIYHHPNIRGIVGLTNIWEGGTGAGASFGAVCLKPFFKMPIGYHFHSNPEGTPYEGTTGPNNEYGLIESTTLVSPNF